jgi:hypothetical protein
MTERLELEQATASFDEARHLIRVAYRGSLGADVTVQVYNWIDELVKAVGLETVQGEIFDFQNVSEFKEENLQMARKTSKRMNIRLDMSQLPVALIVKTFYQEEILRGAMQVTPEHQRKRIVRTEEEALAFIDEWNRTHQETPSIP